MHDKEKNETPLMDFKCTFYVVFHSPPRVVKKNEVKEKNVKSLFIELKKQTYCVYAKKTSELNQEIKKHVVHDLQLNLY